jgi:hypothetical protein
MKLRFSRTKDLWLSRSLLVHCSQSPQPYVAVQWPDPSRPLCALAALSLVGDPLADVGRTAPDFYAFGFGLNQKLHRVTADQFYLGEFDGDDSASVERDANDLQIFRTEPAADVKGLDPVQSKVGRFGTSLACVACRLPMSLFLRK